MAPADDELSRLVGGLLETNPGHEPGSWWQAGIDEALAGGPASASGQTCGAVGPLRKSRGTESP
jgi:hypothetical protein